MARKVGGAQRVRGIALIEAAAAACVALPIGLTALVIMAFMYDVGVVQSVSETILAGQREPVMSWVPGATGGSIGVEQRAIEAELDRFVIEAVAAVNHRTQRLQHISSKACYWVFQVDRNSGALTRERAHGCRQQGALGEVLALEAALSERVSRMQGIPTLATTNERAFLDEVVVWGVAVGGAFRGIPLLFDGTMITDVAVELPRREVTL